MMPPVWFIYFITNMTTEIRVLIVANSQTTFTHSIIVCVTNEKMVGRHPFSNGISLCKLFKLKLNKIIIYGKGTWYFYVKVPVRLAVQFDSFSRNLSLSDLRDEHRNVIRAIAPSAFSLTSFANCDWNS